MFLNDVRNIVVLTGFLAVTENPRVRRLFQNVAAATYVTVIVPDGLDLPNMAPVDLSGPIVFSEGEHAVLANFIGPASEASFVGVANFLKTGDAGPELEKLDFSPLENWRLKPELAAGLSQGDSTWGLSDFDEMAGWVAEGVANPPRRRLMNRLIITGLPVSFGRRVDLADRVYNPCHLRIIPDQPPVEVRFYNDMRLWSSVTRIVAGAAAPITITGTFRVKFNASEGRREVFVDAVDVYAATVEDMPNGVPEWMQAEIQGMIARRRVNLDVGPVQQAEDA